MAETVNHPDHYGGDTPYEVIKVLEAWLTPEEFAGFLKGNVIKYLARANKKGGGAEDAAKAAWYAARLRNFYNDESLQNSLHLSVGQIIKEKKTGDLWVISDWAIIGKDGEIEIVAIAGEQRRRVALRELELHYQLVWST